MEKAMYQRYADVSPIGTIALCGSSSFGIMVFEPDEVDKYKEDCDLICAWNHNGNEWGYHKHKIHHTSSGRAYIRKGSLRIYLDEIMRN